MTHHEPLYIALDQGGHSSRAIALTATGDTVAKAQVPIATHTIDATRIEHSADELSLSLKTCCEQIAKKLGDDTKRIVCAGLATQRSSVVGWNRHTGAALTPVLSWQDRRAAAIIDAQREQTELIEHLTGLAMSPHYGASKLRWLLEHVDQVQAARATDSLTIGPLASFLVRSLTNSNIDFCDPANASRTLLWNRHTRNWSEQLCALFDIDESLLPQSVTTRHDFGHIDVGAFRVPLKLVTGDQSAAIYAFGHYAPATAFINLGTGAFLQCPIGQRAATVPGLLNSVVYQDDNYLEYVLEGTVNGAGRALTWWSKKAGKASRQLVADATESLATDATFTSRVPVFLNGISGLGSPYWLGEFRSRFVCSDSETDPAADTGVIAILESIVFLLSVNIGLARTHTGRIEQIVLTGGLASVDYLCQTLANITGIATARSTLREATAKGVGYLLSQDPKWPGISNLTLFEPRFEPALDHRHKVWHVQMQNAIRDHIV